MPTTKGFPYPLQTDDPNVPGDIQALAEAVDTELDDYLTEAVAASTYRTISASYTKTEIDTKYETATDGPSAIRIGTAYDTPNGAGRLVITHGAGFTPSRAIVTLQEASAQIAGAAGYSIVVDTGSFTASVFDVLAYKNSNGDPITTAIRVNFICW